MSRWFLVGLLPLTCLRLSSSAWGAATFHQPLDSGEGCDTCHALPSVPGPGMAGANHADRTEGCLTCHDGSLAVDSFPNTRGSPSRRRSPGSAPAADPLMGPTWQGFLDVDGGREHPVEVSYEGDGLHEPSEAMATGVMLYGAEGDWRVECTSCHDPHVNGRRAMLRGREGALCTSCHEK